MTFVPVLFSFGLPDLKKDGRTSFGLIEVRSLSANDATVDFNKGLSSGGWSAMARMDQTLSASRQ